MSKRTVPDKRQEEARFSLRGNGKRLEEVTRSLGVDMLISDQVANQLWSIPNRNMQGGTYDVGKSDLTGLMDDGS
jgi:hypothetical protein